MAMLFDDYGEGRDRRLALLLKTAETVMQNQQNREALQMKREEMAQTALQNKASSQQAFAKLGYGPATPQSSNEMNMSSNPNRGQSLSDVYGQNFTPNPNLLKSRQSGGTPRFVMNEDGEYVQLPGILVETPAQKMERKVAGATEDQKNQLQANQNAGLVFNELKKLSSGLEQIGGYEGMLVKGGNIVSRGKLNPQAQAYIDFMPAAAVNLYRGITGDTRLSDYDANRAYSMVWNIDQDGKIKGIKEGSVENLLKARNILLSNNIYSTKKDDKITSLDDVMFVSNAVNKGVSEDEIISYLKGRKKK